jgi:hypothetical protein
MEMYELIINEDSETGVDYIALVDQPAIESNWQTFNKQEVKQQFEIQSEEKRIVSGYLMKADLPIVRVNEKGETFHVVFRAKTVFDIAKKYMQNGFNKNVNLSHDKNQLAEDVFLFESRIIDKDRKSFAPDGFEDAPDGSWWGSMYVANDEIWQQIKDGVFKGFSVEGIFLQSKPKEVEEELIEEIKDLIYNFLKQK